MMTYIYNAKDRNNTYIVKYILVKCVFKHTYNGEKNIFFEDYSFTSGIHIFLYTQYITYLILFNLFTYRFYITLLSTIKLVVHYLTVVYDIFMY
jgi:hypothetical protein